MRRLIAVVISALVMAIAFTALLSEEESNPPTEGPPPANYFQQLQDCGAACFPLAAILMVVAD
jgi:flagellar basal body-associated protein FliL